MVIAIWHNKAVYERFNMPHTTWLAKLVQAVRAGSVKKRAAINVLAFLAGSLLNMKKIDYAFVHRYV